MALNFAKKNTPDLIFLDIMMPEMDGFEVCRRLKSDENLCHIPIIFISALDDIANKVTAFSFGEVDYITKPFQEEEVFARMENHLKLRRAQKELEKYNHDLEEYEIMKQHVDLGALTLQKVHEQYPSNSFVNMGVLLTKHHHEKWNGKGFPHEEAVDIIREESGQSFDPIIVDAFLLLESSFEDVFRNFQ